MKINDVEFNVSLQDILDELVAQLRANGIEYIQKMNPTSTHIQICCPYHNDGMERRPSAGIRKSDGLFHCFACDEVHSLPEVISFCLGHEDDIVGSFGWKWLVKNFATIEVEERKDVELDLERNQDSRKHRSSNTGTNRSSTTDNDIHGNNQEYVTEEELEQYRYIHPYMYKRKLTDEIIEMFDIGYDKSSKTITFPVRDINGNCLFIARRSVQTKYFSLPSGVEKPIYGLYELNKVIFNEDHTIRKAVDTLIICESMLDALTCWVYGRYAVALNGLGSGSQFKTLRTLPIRKYILATDNDEAGRKARDRIRKNVPNKLITEYVNYPENCKDINDMTKEQFENLEEVF